MPNTKIPQFPDFIKLTAAHQAELQQLVGRNHLYSDYNFISLWSWDHQAQLQLCLLNDNLVIRFQDYLNPTDYFYSFLGMQATDETARTLLQRSQQEGIQQLRLIPQFVIENLEQPADFIITEDRDSFDYIIAVGDAITLNGYSDSKKRALHKIQREHGHHLKVQELDIRHDSTVEQILRLFDKWSAQSNTTTAYKENELNAIKKLVKGTTLVDTANLHVLGLFIDGQLSAFSINEVLADGFAMGHFKKAVRDYKGLGVALDHYTAKSLAARGVTHVNHEQDMGLEGLRRSKLGSNPVYFLKKYTLSLASD